MASPSHTEQKSQEVYAGNISKILLVVYHIVVCWFEMGRYETIDRESQVLWSTIPSYRSYLTQFMLVDQFFHVVSSFPATSGLVLHFTSTMAGLWVYSSPVGCVRFGIGEPLN
jgi:hypothetical protein